MFNVDDLVIIKDQGCLYTHYYDWFIKLGNIELAARYSNGNKQDLFERYGRDTVYKILAKRTHGSLNDTLYAICPIINNEQLKSIFLIGEEGLELSKEINVGDIICITDIKGVCPYDLLWFKENNREKDMEFFSYGNFNPSKNVHYKVLAKEISSRTEKMSYEIQSTLSNTDPIFLMKYGIEPVN